MNNVIERYKRDIDKLIKVAENNNNLSNEFKESIRYFHDCFAYLLSLIEIKDQEKN